MITSYDGLKSKITNQLKINVTQHEYFPSTLLRKSTIRAYDKEMKLLQEIILAETTSGQIEMYVDGKLRTRVDDI